MVQYSLKELRARYNMTQRDVASIVGVSVQAYNAWEKDLSRVAFGNVLKLAEIFEVSVEDIKVVGNAKAHKNGVSLRR